MQPARKKTFHGVTIGILMVKTTFERLPGDVGHAGTWDFPVQFRIVEEATPERMMALDSIDLVGAFTRAGLELAAGGVDGIATTCGFLALYQDRLAAALPVPVATSALLQAPMVSRLLPRGRRVGIMTFSRENLSAAHLAAVGVPADTPVVGMPADSAFRRSIKGEPVPAPVAVQRAEVLAAAGRLMREHPDVGAIVSECANLTPFSDDISRAFGVPVYDAVTLIEWFHAGLKPRAYLPPD
ncbi:aspartate/glutamate racemase family protein [Pigmentiphaga soli]|uniref:Aspartate/glutamate racemase family protein n=1 Tax=Pigmentiphaga soli TaxID=1007095 RepID=A0ABP8GCL4_9BURK